MNSVATATVFKMITAFDIIPICVLINRIVVNNLITRMLVYSAIKISANRPLLYSTLNPDTSSDSPSAKSNGVRFVSARLVINHVTPIGNSRSKIQEFCEYLIRPMSSDFNSISALSRINDILTS